MRLPRFLILLMSIFVCISLIRAVNGAGGLSLNDILVDLQSFTFDFQDVADLISLFREGVLADKFVGWNSELTGLDGFFINIGNVLQSFFTMIVTLITSVVKALWSLIVETVTLLFQIFSLVTDTLGYNFEVR